MVYDVEKRDDMDREKLRRVVAIINGKGGVGKSTISANVGGILAASGWRVLIVDLDHQANLGLDLGYHDTDVDDDGRELAKALTFGDAPAPLSNVRPNLDVLQGGSDLESAADALASLAARGRADHARLAVARALEPIADNYDIILLDCPPANDMIQSAAAAAARYVLIPVKTDPGSLKGLRITAGRIASVASLNPDVDLLGVVIFDSGTGARRVRESFVDDVVLELGGESARPLVFEPFLRHSEATANMARSRGVLVTELEATVRSGPKWYEVLRRAGESGERVERVGPISATSVADDIQAITAELVARIADREDLEASNGQGVYDHV